MRTLSMSGLEPNFGEGAGIFEELRARRIKAEDTYKKNVEMSFDEEKVGKGVSEFFAAQLPAGRKIDKAKHPTEFAAVNAAFDEDDPRKQLMPVVKKNYQALLRNKEFKGAEPNRLLDLAYQTTVKGTPSDQLEGATYEDDIHRYKYKEDTARFGLGKDVAAAPGYEEWLEKEKARPMEDRQIGFGEMAAYNLGFMAAGRVLKKPVANAIGRGLLKVGVEKLGQTMLKVGPPQTKLVGAALTAAALAIPESLAWNAVAKSDWYRAREDEPIKRELAAIALTGLTSAAAYKTVGKQVVGALKHGAETGAVSEAMLKTFLKDSSAENIMKIGAARRAEKEALGKISDVFNKAQASGAERKAWFEHLAKSEDDFTRTGWFGQTKYTDEDALKGVIRSKISDAEQFMFDKRLPVPFTGEQSFGKMAGEGLWDGTREVAKKGPQVIFKPYTGSTPIFQEEISTARLALPPGQQALPPGSGGGGPVNPSGGAGGGGIFGVKQRKLLSPFDEMRDNFGWGGEEVVVPKAALEKSFSKLSTDDAIFVMDQVSTRGKSLQGALVEIERTNILNSALVKTEESVAKASQKATVLPPDSVLGYEGSQVAAEAGKAGKVLALTNEVNAASGELAVRKVAEKNAISSVAKEAKSNLTLRDVIEGKEAQALLKDVGDERLNAVNIFDENLKPKEANELTAAMLKFFGDKFRANRIAVPAMSEKRAAKGYEEVARIGKGKGKGKGKVKAVDGVVKASERAVVDAESLEPEFLGTFNKKTTISSYVQKIAEDPKYGDPSESFAALEGKRLYNLAMSKGIPEEQVPNTTIFREFKKAQEQARFIRDEVLDPVVDDLTEFGGTKAQVDRNFLKSIIPISAVGTMSVAAVLGLPEDSHASVASAIGEAAARGIKALPKAWINTVKELQDLSKLGKKEIENKFKQLIKDAEAAGYVSRTVGDSKILPARMLVPNFTELAKELYGSTAGAVKSVKMHYLGAERIFSPWARGALHYKTGANPSVHIAAMQTAITENSKNAYTVLNNIMKDVTNGKSAAREVAKMFAPLADEYGGVVQSHQIVSTKIKQLEKAIPVMEKVLKDGKLDPAIAEGYAKKLAEARKKLEVYNKHMREDITPKHTEFMAKHDAITKEAAKKYASTRIFLAANDTEAFEYYPWLRSMLTKEEKVAATHVKAMMKSYEESSIAAGLNVITNRPYMHYGWHPSWNETQAKVFAESIGMDLPITTVPNNQFHSRMVGAVPMMPDVYHSVQSYIPMAEKILGWRAFWNMKGPKDASWHKHMMSSTVQHNAALRSYWNAIKDASVPAEQMMVDKWMDRYTSFEVLRLLGGSPSVAYKHFFKNIGTWGSLGFQEAASHMGAAATTAARNKMTSPEGVKWLSKLGIDTTKMTPKFWDDAAKSYTSQMKRLSVLDDMDLRPASQLSWFDNFMGELNHKAGFMVNAVESYDRVHSFLAAGEMAAKRGLTARDASYAIYDTILKNNFLGGALNPSWAKNPSVRALMLFQTTAFKIFERRLVTLHQSNRAIGEAWKEAAKMNWTWDKAFSEIKTLKDFVVKGEYEFKKGIITDALAGERDFLGQFAVRQQMREMLYAGVVLGGGAMLGHDYSHHISHLPFVQKSFEGEPVIGFSPIAKAIWDTKEGKVYAGEESEFGMVGDFLNNWFRSQGPIPQMVNKAINVSRDDIPEIYREEGFLPKEFRYFWAIPSTKEKE